MATYAEPVVERRTFTRRAELTLTPTRSLLAPLGRALFVAIFIVSGFRHFGSDTIGYAASAGVPMAGILVPLSGVLAILGGLSILLGFHAKVGAWLLVLFLVPVTMMMHAFWAVDDPAQKAMQQGMFMKNVALLGGAFLVAHFGAGAFSLDARRNRRMA